MGIVVRAGAEIAALICGVVATLWISRIVGPSYFGYYAVMMTIVTVGGLWINAGLPTVGSQRVANDAPRIGEVLWIVTVIRGFLAAAAIAGALVILAIVPMAPVLRDYLRIGLVLWAIIPLSDGWVLISLGRLRAISGLRVAGSLITLMTAFILVRNVSDAGNVAWVPVTGAVLNAVGTCWFALRASSPRRPADGRTGIEVRAYLRLGLQTLKADISTFIFTSSDRLFLYAFATPAVVGLYAAAYSIIQPFYMINVVVWDAMYLPVAQAFAADRLGPTFRRYVDLMSFATLPLGFFLMGFAPFVISTVYGPSYAPAAAYLAILGWVITFGYTSGIAVIPFSAWNRQREYGNATAIGGVLNLGLNFLLIPPLGGLGAAWATVAAKIAVSLAGVRYFRRVTDYPVLRDFVEYLGVAALALAASVLATHVLASAIAGIVIFGLTYLVLVAVVRWRRYQPWSWGRDRPVLGPDAGAEKR